MEMVLIAAVAQNGVIGKGNSIPWYIPEDLKRFKELTTGHPVIMGRKTYESIMNKLGHPLTNRTNIVLSNSGTLDGKRSIIVAKNLDEALDLVFDNKSVYVIGGQQVYEQTIDRANRLEITHIHRDYEGDSYFPEIQRDIWKETKRDNKGEYSFVTYLKKS